MAGQPWIKFWVGDWRKDPDVALLSAETKGVWLEMIWAMHEKDTYKLSGTLRELALMAGCWEDEVKRAIAELKKYNVAKVCHNKSVTVTITSRKRHADVIDRDKARLRKQQQRVRDSDTIDDTEMSQTSHNNVTLSDSDSDSNNKEKVSNFDEVFWNPYAKKVGRKKCAAAWDRLPEKTQGLVADHLPGFVAATPDPKYRPNPATYLGGERWLDEDLPPVEDAKDAPRDLTRDEMFQDAARRRIHSDYSRYYPVVGKDDTGKPIFRYSGG